MKKLSHLAIPLVTLLAIAGLWLVLRWVDRTHQTRGAQPAAASTARLIDEDAALFVHLPDLNTFAREWETADFPKLGVTDGLAVILREFLSELPIHATWKQRWRQCQALQMQQIAFAISLAPTKLEGILLFRSPHDSLSLWSTLIDDWHGADSVYEQTDEREGIVYRTAVAAESQWVHARWEDWHCLATDSALIERALARLRKVPAPSSLADQPAFQQCLQSLQNNYVVLSYLARDTPDDGNLTSTPRRRLAKIQHTLTKAHARAAAFTAHVRQGELYEESSLLTVQPPQATSPPTAFDFEVTLGLTSPNTLVYASANQGESAVRRYLLERYTKRWEGLAQPELMALTQRWEQHFTGTCSLQLEPMLEPNGSPTGNEALAAIVAFTVRDHEHVERDLATLATARGSGILRSPTGTYLLDPALLPPALANLVDDVHLHPSNGLLIISDQLEGLQQVRRRYHLETLQRREDFQRAFKLLPAPETGLVFLDSQALLQRGHDALRHPLIFATFWLGVRSQTHLRFDLDQLALPPHPSTILVRPTMATWRPTVHGYHQTALGTLSPLQWLLGGGTLLAVIDQAFLESAPIDDADGFVTPMIEQELLDMIEP